VLSLLQDVKVLHVVHIVLQEEDFHLHVVVDIEEEEDLIEDLHLVVLQEGILVEVEVPLEEEVAPIEKEVLPVQDLQKDVREATLPHVLVLLQERRKEADQDHLVDHILEVVQDKRLNSTLYFLKLHKFYNKAILASFERETTR